MFVLDSQGVPGWRVVTPLKSDDGIFVLVDRGFIADEQRDPSRRPGSQPEGHVEVSGYLSRHPAGQGLFTPDNDAAKNNWYWWDVPAMLAFGKIDPGSRVTPAFAHTQNAPLDWIRVPWPARHRFETTRRESRRTGSCS